MKSTQVRELFLNIKVSIVSFFSILMFVALAVGVFLGISWSGPALENAIDGNLSDGSFHDIQIQFPYGLTEDDMAQLASLDGVTDVEGSYASFQKVLWGEKKLTVRVQSIPERIDTLTVREGSMPTKKNEIAVVVPAAENYDLRVGDVIEFVSDYSEGSSSTTLDLDAMGEDAKSNPTTDKDIVDEDGLTYLNGAEYKVVALVVSPEYLANDSASYGFSPSGSGAIDIVAWVPVSAFDTEKYMDAYPVVNVHCKSLDDLNTFSDEYREKSDDLESKVLALGDTLGTVRYDKLHDDAQQKIDEAEKKLEDGKAQIAQGEKDLEDGRAKLETERAEGEKKLADAYQQLLGYEEQRKNAEWQISQGRARVAEGQQALATIDAAKSEVDALVNGYWNRANDAKDRYEAKLKEIEEKAKAAEASAANEAQQQAENGEENNETGESAGSEDAGNQGGNDPTPAPDPFDPVKAAEEAKTEYDAELDAIGAEMTSKLQPYASKIGVQVNVVDHTNIFQVLENARTYSAKFEDIPITYQGKTMTVREARAALSQAEQELNNAEAQLSQKKKELSDGWAAYYAGKEELATLVAEAEQKIADGEKRIEEMKEMVAQYEPILADAKADLAAMQEYTWTVMTRFMNGGVGVTSTFSDITNNLSLSMALLFVIVGALVSYSAVTRIVHSQVSQIGAKKALGMVQSEVTASYLCYSALAVFAGVVVGVIAGVTLVEGIVGFAFGGMFCIEAYPPYVGVPLLIIDAAIEMVLVLGATWLACRDVLRKHAVDLLRGEEPPKAKERFFEKWRIWSKVPLFTKVMINNCINEKRRVFSTIVGVAGCTALIVTAVMLNNNMQKNLIVQYEDVYEFNTVAYSNEDKENSAQNMASQLEDDGYKTALVLRKLVSTTQPDGENNSLRIYVPQDEEEFKQFYHVQSISDGEFDASEDGVWVSESYVAHFDVQPGDTISVNVGDGMAHALPILGFYKYYLMHHEIVMGRDYYEREFETDYEPNAVLLNTSEDDFVSLSEELMSSDDADALVDDKAAESGVFEQFSTVSSAVVVIYLILSILMAVVVLLNLNVSCIEEKKRELIVLMICGFSIKDAKRYIYNDLIVLTIIGILLGILLGNITGAISLGAIEGADALLIKDPDAIAMAAGTAGSAVLSFIMCVLALRRISQFELTDINRF